MATTINIAQRTLPIGQATFGPRAMNKERTFTLTVDRTVVGGLNSLDATTTLEVDVNSSVDGVTYTNEASFTTVGGIISNHNGQENSNVLAVQGMGGQGTFVEIVTTVGGASTVVVAGSIVLT